MPTSTRSSKPRGTSSPKNPVVVIDSDPNPTPPMALEDVYPDKPIPKPKINPALLASNPAVFQRLSEDLKIIPSQSKLSINEILLSTCYQPPKLMEDILEDFDRYGIDFKESNTRFTAYANSTNRLTLQNYVETKNNLQTSNLRRVFGIRQDY